MTEDESRIERGLERTGRFAARNPRAVLSLSIAVIVVAGIVAIATVQLNMGVLLYLNDGSETAQNWAEIESDYDRGNVVFVVVETGEKNVTDPATVRLVDRLDDRYTDIERLGAVRSLADVVRLGANGRIPDTERGVRRAIDRVAARSNTTRTLIRTMRPGSGQTILLLSYGNVSAPPESGGYLDFVETKDSKVIERKVTGATEAVDVPASASVSVTGASIFENAALELMITDVLTLFAGGFLLVLVAVYLVMRRRLDSGWLGLLALGTAVGALVVMLGVMGLLGYDLNAIMMSVLPVGLGLGVDYGLQIQTRYREERDAGRSPEDAAGVAVRTTGRTLLLAAGTTAVGFGSLLVAPIPPVRQFGVTAGTSVVASMALSVTLLIALLVTFDDESRTHGTASDDTPRTNGNVAGDGAAGSFEAVANAAARAANARPLLILLVVLPAVSGGAVVYSDIETTQQMLDYWPQDLDERTQFERTTETVTSPKTVYVIVEADSPYDPSTIRDVASFQRRLVEFPEVNAVGGPVSAVTATRETVPANTDRVRRLVEKQSRMPLSGVESPSQHPDQLLLTLRVDDIRGAQIRSLIDRIETAADETEPGSDIAVTGKPVVNRVIIENVTAGFVRMTMLSFTVALLFLVVTLRSIRDAVLLVLSVPATAALLMLGAMYLLDIPWNPGTVSMASIALGIGVDYGLHVHERYRELLEMSDLGTSAAMAAALRKLSRPIFGSALTTMAGFGVLLFSRFPVVRQFGKTLLLVILFSLLATFVTFPAATFLATSLGDRNVTARGLLPLPGGTSRSRPTGNQQPPTAGDAATPARSPDRDVESSSDGSPGVGGVSTGKTDESAPATPAEPAVTTPDTPDGVACPNCGVEMAPSNNYCVACRTRVSGLGTVLECPGCGTEIAEDDNYCTECGEHL